MGWVTITSGLVLGSAFGYALQRGGFCMNTAFRSILFEKDYSVLRAYLLALVINSIVVQLLDYFAVITITRAPFFWPALIVGGFVFGCGMVLSGGCTSGTLYRCARGMMGSWAALIGFALGAVSFSGGPLSSVVQLLRAPVVDYLGEELTLYHLLPIDPLIAQWVLTIALAIPAVIWLARSPKSKFVIGWNWPLTGTVVGLIGVLAWVFSSLSQRNFGLSITQPVVSLARFAVTADTAGFSWASWFILGLPTGALASALFHKDFALRLPEPKRLTMQLFGGILMGAGAAIAGGCNIGHGITGVSTLSAASITATIFTIGGVWMTTWLVYRSAARAMRQA